MKVLFVEDSELYLHFRRGFFVRLGCRILNARSAALALETIEEERPDLVVVSSRLPDSRGADLCGRIRDLKGHKAPRLILLCEPEEADPGPVAWDERVQRPVEPEDLMARISALLKVPQRRSPRVAVSVQVAYGNRRDRLSGASQNLGPEGMLIEAAAALPAGTQLEVEFTLPGSETVLRSAAEVVRSSRLGGGRKHAIAVRFLDPDPAMREAILAYVG